MKKGLLLFSLVSLMSLAACGGNNTSSNLTDSSGIKEQTALTYAEDEKDVFITEYICGNNVYTDLAIEIYNNGKSTVDLSKYSIETYRNGYTPTAKIGLKGMLNPGEVYILANSSANETILAKANQKEASLMFTGKNTITLSHNNKVVDVIGYPGYAVEYAKGITLLRRSDKYEASTQFNRFDWVDYGRDNFEHLGEVKTALTIEELLEGPKLEDKYFNKDEYPFEVVTSASAKGGGGAVLASIRSNIDGDTTNLFINDPSVDPSKFMSSTSYYGKVNGLWWVRVRYQSVDTPESYPGNIQEFGYDAKYYTAALQNAASELYLQTIADDSLLCNYDRLMGYVWAGKNTLVNFESIKHGYSTVNFDTHYKLTYRGVPYEEFMKHANNYARENKLGLYGGRDPYWDYENNRSLCENAVCDNIYE